MRGNVWVLLSCLCFGSGEHRRTCTAWCFPAFLWPELLYFKQVCLCLCLIFISFLLCLMISLFCFNADAVHLRWKRCHWALHKWWLELRWLFSGSVFRGWQGWIQLVQQEFSHLLCSGVQLPSNSPIELVVCYLSEGTCWLISRKAVVGKYSAWRQIGYCCSHWQHSSAACQGCPLPVFF